MFKGDAGSGPEITVDGDGVEGGSPMGLLLLSLVGCMAIDIRVILKKSRVKLESLEMVAEGIRAETEPRRYESIELVCRVEGPGEEDHDKVQRAVDLSRDKYCSVLHSLSPDIDLTIRVERA